jgi:hypothetical protein
LLSVEIDADSIIKLPTCQGRFNVKRGGESLLEEWDGKAQSDEGETELVSKRGIGSKIRR